MPNNKIWKKTLAAVILSAFAVLPAASLAMAGPRQTADAAGLDAILKDLASYKGDIESAPFWKLRDYVQARRDDPAARAACEAALLNFLGREMTPTARMAVCRHLRLMGSEKAVPALERMLLAPATFDPALYALQGIPGTETDRALLRALDRVRGGSRTALIAALGSRKVAGAVAVLAPLLKSAEATAAATALGSIGGEDAARSLREALPRAAQKTKPAIAAALFQCAEGLLVEKKDEPALALYEAVAADKTLSSPILLAAVRGRIAASGSQAAGLILGDLKNPDPGIQEAAIGMIKDVFPAEAIGPVCDLLPGLPDSGQVRLIAVLKDYPKAKVGHAILQAARESARPEVRIAALQALERVGGLDTVSFLAETASASSGKIQEASRGALAALSGREFDQAILERLAAENRPAVQRELLAAVSERRIFAAKSVVAGFLDAPQPEIRFQAVKVLRTIGTPSDIPALLDRMMIRGDENETGEIETTIVALSLKIADPDGRANEVLNRLAAAKDPEKRALLLHVLGPIGDDSALPYLRTALKDVHPAVREAAARTIAGWPTSAARDDIAALAASAEDETIRLLGLRGWLRLIRLDKYRQPEAAVADLKKILALAGRVEEKRLVLGALPLFPCPAALDLARGLIEDAAVKAEAQAALDRIQKNLAGK